MSLVLNLLQFNIKHFDFFSVKRKPSIPPAVTLAPPVVRGTAGSHVQIRCDASGYPKPDVTWSKGDGDLPQGKSKFSSCLVKKVLIWFAVCTKISHVRLR